MTEAAAIARARELLGPNWANDKITARKSVKRGHVIRINGRIWMTLEEMEDSGPMKDKEEETDGVLGRNLRADISADLLR